MPSKPICKSTVGAARTHRELIAWQVSLQLVTEVYRLAAQLPAVERYGIATQIRRAALSIPLNIAEGFGRRTRREFARFLAIAEGSLREVQTLVEIVALLDYFTPTEVAATTNTGNRVGFLLHRLRQSLEVSP
jgi:four helix bundle protein